MIYRSNFIKKEFRNAYLENKISRNKLFAFAMFLGFLSFAIYFLLQTLTRSVLKDIAPYLMFNSYFSTLFIYINIAYICSAVYFIIYYDYLFFEEIKSNQWYILVKMGFSSISMICTKIFVKLLMILYVYTVGFLLTIFLTYFLKYPFVINYMVSLYIVGAINLILLAVMTLASSLFIKNKVNARYVVIFIAILIVFFQSVTKYNCIVSNRALMVNIKNIFNVSQSPFLVVSLIIAVICFMICVVKGNHMAQYYNKTFSNNNIKIQDEAGEKLSITLVTKDKNIGYKPVISSEYKLIKHNSILNTVVTFFMITIITLSILFNVMVLAVTFISPDKEIAFFNTIPYVFQSETMEPLIMYNDLAFFKKTDSLSPISLDKIVLYKNKGIVGVARIIKVDGVNEKMQYTVDVDNYLDTSRAGTFKENIPRQNIYGVYIGKSRWLGAVILFANNMFGRLLFLLIPVVLIFFYKPIKTLVKTLNKTELE